MMQVESAVAEPPPGAAVDNIPGDLKALPQWCNWRRERGTKIPYQPNGRKASSTNPATWCSYAEAIAASDRFDGLGFVFTAGGELVGIDLDDCRDAATSAIAPWAQAIIDDVASYAEISPSKTGVKIWCKGKLPGDGSGKRAAYETGAVELYQSARFFTVTGERIGDAAEICDAQAAIKRTWDKVIGAGVTTERPSDLVADPPSRATAADVVALTATLADLPKAISGARGSDATMRAACEIRRAGVYGDDGFALLSQWNDTHCHPPWTERQLRHKWDSARRHVPPAGAEFGVLDTVPAADPQVREPLPNWTATDVGNGQRFQYWHGHDVRYVGNWQKWLAWDGTRWREDAQCRIEAAAKDVAGRIIAEAMDERDPDRRDSLLKWAIASQKRDRLTAMVWAARSEPGIAIQHASLDAHPWLMNCANGTVDLRTGELLPHRRADLLTKSTGVIFPTEPAASDLWARFLDTIFGGDNELVGFVQRLLGLSLVGEVREHILPIFYGSGNNGKTTLLEAFKGSLGDYAGAAPAGFLIAKRHDGHPTEIADLHGRRFVVASETEDGRKLDEALVKRLTGGDALKARRMREDLWEFTPSHTLAMVTNHRPEVHGVDKGIWRRLRLVPFNVCIPDSQVDSALPEKLRAEYPAILRWAVDGCLAWQRIGLAEPEAVLLATRGYREDSDPFARWLRECVELQAGAACKAGEAWGSFTRWFADQSDNECVPLSQHKFGRRLRADATGVVAGKVGGDRSYIGMRLVEYPVGEFVGTLSRDALDASDAKCPLNRNLAL